MLPKPPLVSQAQPNSACVFQIFCVCVCVFWDKRGPLSPVGIARIGKKKERERGRKGQGWKEGVLFAQLHPDHTAIPCALWGGAARGSLRDPVLLAIQNQSPHTVRTWTSHICLIINEWIQAVSEHFADHAAARAQTMPPHSEGPSNAKRSNCKQGET